MGPGAGSGQESEPGPAAPPHPASPGSRCAAVGAGPGGLCVTGLRPELSPRKRSGCCALLRRKTDLSCSSHRAFNSFTSSVKIVFILEVENGRGRGHRNLRRNIPDSCFPFVFPSDSEGVLAVPLAFWSSRCRGNAQSEEEQEASPGWLGADRAHTGRVGSEDERR